jgi:hypothetical protein
MVSSSGAQAACGSLWFQLWKAPVLRILAGVILNPVGIPMRFCFREGRGGEGRGGENSTIRRPWASYDWRIEAHGRQTCSILKAADWLNARY